MSRLSTLALAAAAFCAVVISSLSCNPYDPSYEGLTCGADSACPGGYTCVDNLCTGGSFAEECGDGMIVGDEVCDDGNLMSGDGCDAICAKATCYAPVTHTIEEGLSDAACPTLYVHGGTHEGTFTIGRDVNVVAVGARAAILDGKAAGSVVTVESGVSATLRGFTITNGRAPAGGGVLNRGNLVVDRMIVSENVAAAESPSGAGISNAGGTLTVTATKIAENHLVTTAQPGAVPVLLGGGIHSGGGTLRVDGASVIEENDAIVTGVQGAVGRGAGIGVNNTNVTVSAGSIVRNNVLDIDGGDGRATASGGGLFLSGGSLTVSGGGIIENNAATAKGRDANSNIGANATGGGFYANNTSLTFNVAFLRNNRAVAQGDRQTIASGGGGVLRTGTIEFQSLEVANNRVRAEGLTSSADEAQAFAGGLDIDSAGGSITDTKITSNEVYAVSGSATQQGRAIAGGLRLTTSVMGQRNVSLLRSVIAGNSATSEDGAARAGGMEASVSSPVQGQSWILEVQMLACTVSDNRVQAPVTAQVGGVNVSASAAGAAAIFSLTNSTVSGNKVDGLTGNATTGGLEVSTDKETASANLSLYSSTITNNSVLGATAGAGGINLIVGTGSATTGVSSRNTIVAGNIANANTDCRTNGPVINSTGYNLFGVPTNCMFSGTTTGNLTGAAGLAPLAENGGPTRTHALMSGSQALNAGNPTSCLDRQSSPLTTDQRGQPRVAGGRCDIGAFEQQ